MTNRKQAGRIRFARAARTRRPAAPQVLSIPETLPSRKPGVQDVRAGLRKQLIRVKNRPARFPPSAVWPIEMRADMTAALLDFETTRRLCKEIAAGTAPRPTAVRGTGTALEVVWFRDAVTAFVARRHREQES
jgi:hypothetical protein